MGTDYKQTIHLLTHKESIKEFDSCGALRVSTAAEESNVKLSPTPNSNSYAKILAEEQVNALPGIKIYLPHRYLDKVSGFQQKIMRHMNKKKQHTVKYKGIEEPDSDMTEMSELPDREF